MQTFLFFISPQGRKYLFYSCFRIMPFINVEIKARTKNTHAIRDFLLRAGAEFKGVDEQTDTYFNVPNGRLKLRQGNIENNLIFYHRQDQVGPKQSDFDLLPVADHGILLKMLSNALGIKVVVQKKREIYYIGNVKFHLDALDGLGEFVEIEASNKTFPMPLQKLHEQCQAYMNEFGITWDDLVEVSYSDMLLANSA
jgi:adenylate cyclase class 2